MKAFGTFHIHRKYLLPLLLTVSVFFISQGICVPNFSSLQEASISKVLDAKPRSVLLVKHQLKSSQTRVLKTLPYCDLCSQVRGINPPTATLQPSSHESHFVTFLLDSIDPARAPPA
jgi:hypothetical protein